MSIRGLKEFQSHVARDTFVVYVLAPLLLLVLLYGYVQLTGARP